MRDVVNGRPLLIFKVSLWLCFIPFRKTTKSELGKEFWEVVEQIVNDRPGKTVQFLLFLLTSEFKYFDYCYSCILDRVELNRHFRQKKVICLNFNNWSFPCSDINRGGQVADRAAPGEVEHGGQDGGWEGTNDLSVLDEVKF